jgi:hypothetical protein
MAHYIGRKTAIAGTIAAPKLQPATFKGSATAIAVATSYNRYFSPLVGVDIEI